METPLTQGKKTGFPKKESLAVEFQSNELALIHHIQ